MTTAVALAVHIFGAVIWVGGMFAIYVCLRPALGTLDPPQRLRLMRVLPIIPSLGVGGDPIAARERLLDCVHEVWRFCRCRLAHSPNADDRLADDRAVRLAIPRAVAVVQTRRRLRGLAERWRRPQPYPPDNRCQPAARDQLEAEFNDCGVLGRPRFRLSLPALRPPIDQGGRRVV
jgi:hypothetical protein